MSKVYENEEGYYLCGHPGHTVFIPKDGRWGYNNDPNNPTFSPSVNEGPQGSKIGHHFLVQEGRVQYLADKPNGCSGCPGRAEFWDIPDWED